MKALGKEESKVTKTSLKIESEEKTNVKKLETIEKNKIREELKRKKLLDKIQRKKLLEEQKVLIDIERNKKLNKIELSKIDTLSIAITKKNRKGKP